MPSFNPYSNYGYVALIKESTAGTAVIPTNYLRVMSESFNANYTIQDINEVAGDRERRQRSVEGQIEIAGDIDFFVDPKMIGHFLRSVLGAPTTQTLTAATAFRHTFTVTDNPLTYTFDMQRADAPWVHRYFGVMITNVEFAREENAIKCTASIVGRKAFTQARVLTAANSGTTLEVDQTSGLTTGDTLLVIQKADDGLSDGGYTTVKELTISSIDSETQLTTSTIDVQIDVDDIVMIKRATVSDSDYNQDDPFTFQGGTQIYTGIDVDNTSIECKEDLTLTIMNEVESRYCSGLNRINRFASDVLVKGFMAEGLFTKYYDNESYLDRLRANAEFGMRVFMEGEVALEANSAVAAKTYFGSGNGFSVEASTAGKAGNDINVTIVSAADDTLAASIDGNNVLIELANTTPGNNTGTLIAAAVNALSGVDSVAEGTGAQEFDASSDTLSNTNLGDTVSGSTAAVVGRDASEKPYLQFDFASAVIDNYEVSNTEDEIVTQEIPLKFYKDTDSADNQRKGYTLKIRLVNNISAY